MKYNILTISILLLFSACKHKLEIKEELSSISTENPIRVGVFSGNGASPVCIIETIEAIKIDPEMEAVAISAADIETGKLQTLDALVFPGGSGSKELNNLGESGAAKVKAFGQTKGKGLVGICAGAYLFATTPTYPSLEILKAENYREYYDRGRGLIGIRLTQDGKTIFPELASQDTVFIQYYDGPIYKSFDTMLYSAPALITSDIATHKGYPHNITPGRPAFLYGKYGEGKVFVSVGHPEATAGMRWIVPRMIRWTLNKELIAYGKKLVRPELNQKEILFYPKQKKQEKADFWKLANENDELVIEAIEDLHQLRSRPSIRWSIGLLRHHSPKVVIAAAHYLVESEYTPAIEDLECSVKSANNKIIKDSLSIMLKQMKAMLASEE
jgi:putative intracellular protease/amidase